MTRPTTTVGVGVLPAPTVTVSMPYYRSAAWVREAVESVLAQTHHRLRLVVTADGDPSCWKALAGIDDPRLVRFDLRQNRGRYFADAVVFAAANTRWFTVHDSDDWSAPGRIERLVKAGRRADVAFGGYLQHRRRNDRAIERRPRLDRADDELRHLAHHTGLWRTTALRRIGGPHPDFRVGWDTMQVALAARALRCAQVNEPMYHHRLRPGSLSLSRQTGMQSAYRKAAHVRREALWRQCVESDVSDWPAILAPAPATARAVAAEADRLRGLL